MNIQIRKIVILCCLALSPQFASAQPAPTLSSFQFSCVSFKELSLDLYYLNENTYEKIDMRPQQRSRLYKLKPVGELVSFYTQETDENGVISYRVVGQAKVIPQAERMLFFLSELGVENELPLRVVGVDDSLNVFPPGSFRFVNMTNLSLRAVIEDVNVLIAPGSMRVINPEIPADGGFIPFYVGDESGQEVLLETAIYSQPRGREMLFVTLEPVERRSDQVKIQYLSENVPPPIKKPE